MWNEHFSLADLLTTLLLNDFVIIRFSFGGGRIIVKKRYRVWVEYINRCED